MEVGDECREGPTWRGRVAGAVAPAWTTPPRTFSTRRDAADFDAEVRRQRRAGSLGALDAGTESLGEYVTEVWAGTRAVTLAPKTRVHYASLYDHHLEVTK